ncbi:aurofusarin biosynthesis cluster protein S-like, partial [Teratosphaeria destructans]
MKFSSVVPLAALSTAFVVPSEELLGGLAIETPPRAEKGGYSKGVEEKDWIIASVQKHDDEVTDTASPAWHPVSEGSTSALDQALDSASDLADTASKEIHDAAFDVESFFRTDGDDFDDTVDEPDAAPPRTPPHHPPRHGPPNETVYELIAKSKYTTKLATLIHQYPDLVDTLNRTEANYTVFAPHRPRLRQRSPDHAPRAQRDQLRRLLQYHVVDGLYPAARLASRQPPRPLLRGGAT